MSVFNAYTLFAAVGIGCLSALATLRWPFGDHSSRLSWSGVGRGVLVGCLLSMVAAMIAGSWTSNFFALVHVAYTISTIGIPLFAALLLWRRRNGPRVLMGTLAVCLLAAPLGVYATHIEPFWLRVDHVQLAASPQLAGLRVGVLSDLQTTEIGDYENRAIDTLIEQDPDVLLIPGDFWQLPAEDFDRQRPQFEAALARIDASFDLVLAVSGDTDSTAMWRSMVEGTDIIVLHDQVVDVSVRGYSMRVAGLSTDEPTAARANALSQLADARDDMATILLGHKPDIVYELPRDAPVDLVVAGHTHGGQIQIPFFGPIMTLSNVPRDAAGGGLHQVNGQQLYVSTGVGRERHLAPQVRFGARPSVGVIVFTA